MAQKALGLVLIAALVACTLAIHITISSNTTHTISQTLYGYIFHPTIRESLTNRCSLVDTCGRCATFASYPYSTPQLPVQDINHSGDGGLYAELLQNRAFQIVTPGTTT
jgi:hypothetical protein